MRAEDGIARREGERRAVRAERVRKERAKAVGAAAEAAAEHERAGGRCGMRGAGGPHERRDPGRGAHEEVPRDGVARRLGVEDERRKRGDGGGVGLLQRGEAVECGATEEAADGLGERTAGPDAVVEGEARAQRPAPERVAAARVADAPSPAAVAVQGAAVVRVHARAGPENGGDAPAVRLRRLDDAADVGPDLERQAGQALAEDRGEARALAVRHRAREPEERAGERGQSGAVLREEGAEQVRGPLRAERGDVRSGGGEAPDGHAVRPRQKEVGFRAAAVDA